MGKLIFALLFLVMGLAVYKIFNKMTLLSQSDKRNQNNFQFFKIISRSALTVGIALPVVIIAFSTLRVIPAGHVGIATLFGKVQPQPLYEGLNIVNPLLDVTVLSNQVQKHSAKYDAASKDLQSVHVDMVLNYRLLPDKSAEVYQKIGVNYADVIIVPAGQEVLKANTAQHNVAEILKQRAVIKMDVQKGLSEWLSKYGIELKEVSLANIRFDPDYEKAVERAQIAERDAAQASWNAQAAINKAKGDGDAAREKARGDADALRIKGEAEATYNARVSASLTPVLIQQQYLKTWDGKLPQVMPGSGSDMFLQLPGNFMENKSNLRGAKLQE